MSKKILNLATFLVVVFIVIFNLTAGVISSSDTATYDGLANQLLESKFNYAELLKGAPAPVILYLVPLTLFALVKSIFLENWKYVVVLINSFAICGVILTYIKLAKFLKINNFLIAVSLLCFILFPDFLIWPHYVLTDTVYSYFLISIILLTVKFCDDPGMHLTSLALFFLCMLLLFTRPTAVPAVLYIMSICFFYTLNKNTTVKNQSIFLTSVCCISISLFMAFMVCQAINGSIQGAELRMMSDFIRQGVVIHDRPETYISFNGGFFSVIKVFLIRFIYFFSPFASQFSVPHKILNLIIFLLVGSCILFGEVRLFRGSQSLSDRSYIVRSVIWGLIICIATFHSITLIDYDWRYRYPLIPLLFMLALIHVEGYISQNKIFTPLYFSK